MKLSNLLRGAFASAIFALLAVSVSENATAQTVQVCSAGQAEHSGINPHTPTTFGEQSCRTDGAIITFPAGKSGFVCRQCAGNLATGTTGFCDSIYQIEGDTLSYCGPRSQCDAVGGILVNAGGTPTGEVCKCDAGNARIGGECVTGETEADCETFEEYANTEDADRTEGACRPRVAGDCTDPNDAFMADTTNGGGTCECNQGYSRNGDGACILGQVCTNNGLGLAGTDPHNPPMSQANSCADLNSDDVIVTVPGSAFCAVCKETGGCAADSSAGLDDNNVVYSIAGVSLNFCGSRAQCEAVSGIVENGDCTGACDSGFERIAGECVPVCRAAEQTRDPNGNCVCPNNAHVEFNNECLAECPAHTIMQVRPGSNTCTECPVNEIRGSDGTCGACPIENEVRALEATMCTCPDATHFDNTEDGTCDERISSTCTGIQRYDSGTNTCIDCADNEIQSDSDVGSCVACPIENEVRTGSETVCSCPEATHYGDDTAMTCVERLTCPGNQRYNSSDNTCIDCAENEVQSDSDAGSCEACPPTQVRTGSETACSACPGFANTAAGTCDAIAECTAVQSRLVNNVCTECDRDQHLVNGACVACDPNEVRAQNAAACTCPVFTDTDGSCIPFTVCDDPLDLNEDDNTCFCPDTHFGDADSCVAHTNCPAESEDRNPATNTCRCADDFEGEAGSCTACAGGKQSRNGAASCTCPADMPFDRNGVCEASLAEECADAVHLTYTAETNTCACPAGQRENADETACEAIPASGGGGSSGGGAAAAIIAVPVVLIGGYWLLGGFGYVDPYADFRYSGENGNLSYAAQGGFDLNHGNLNSYARAIQENGDAVSYESGISWTQDYLALTYDAAESDSEYVYDFAASMKAEFGPFTIAPAAAAEFSYQRTGEEWSSDASAGLAADWTAHRWIVKAQSAFAGAGAGYRLDIRREL